MQCSGCQTENREGARFCRQCGATFGAACPRCGAKVEAGSKFCDSCGAPIAATPALAVGPSRFASPEAYTPKHLAERILTSKSALEGERKQVTVLFADTKGSTELLADRDPEEARKILDPVLERMMEAVHRYEGTVNQVMGDGIMALFGAPIAHEDHAVRACYAALWLQESVKKYSEEARRTQGAVVKVRVGLNSGEVVVRTIGSDLRMDYTAVGETTHLAARMEQIADPGAIAIAPGTLALAEGYIEVKPLGPVLLKGFDRPIEISEVVAASAVRSRLQPAVARGLTKFVGRTTEMALLYEALESAKVGHGQVVAVVGEPGVGKSRLYYEFTHSHRVHGCLILETTSVSFGKTTAYLPVVELLKGYFRIEGRDDARTIREKIAGKLVTLDRTLESHLSAFLWLLDVPIDDPSWETLEPPQRRERTLEGVKRLLIRESHVQPVVVLFEDLHWIDSETQAVLNSLIESLAAAPFLLLVDYRPEYQHPWASKTYYRQLRIDPLSPASAGELLDALLGDDITIRPLKPMLIARTEGTPFFLEEGVRTLVETGVLVGERGRYRAVKPLATVQMPVTVRAILAARIDRLEAGAKAALQMASVVGKKVPLVLLQTIAESTDEELRGHLGDLLTAEFLYEASLFPEIEYTFKHALVQEVAYQSLLRSTRQHHHRRIAAALERRFPEICETQPDLLAHHYTEAGLSAEALPYWERAGQRAIQRSANLEAIGHLTRGLELLKILPDSAERTQQELDLQITLGPVLMTTKGWSAPEVKSAYARALELCEQMGETSRLFPVLRGLWEFYEARGQLQQAHELAARILSLTQRVHAPDLLVIAHHVLGDTLFWLGDLIAAREHFERCLALYDRQRHRSLAFSYGGYDPGVACFSLAACTSWHLGYPALALKMSQEALTLARDLSHPHSLAFALNWTAILHYLRREARLTQEVAEAGMGLCREQGFPFYLAVGTILRGWSLAAQGQPDEGLGEMHKGLAAYRTAGAELEQPFSLVLLAEAYGKSREAEAGLRLLGEASTMMHEHGQRAWEAELNRLRGELLLLQVGHGSDVLTEAETCFRQALDIASRQQAKSFELRAATSLSRLLQRQGKRDDAQRMLAEIYGWFTEGFDTRDLREAKALLGELSHS